MTSGPDHDVPDRERRLYEVLGAYFADLQSGRVPDRRELLAHHPDLADSLVEFFAEQDRFHRAVEPFRAALDADADTPDDPVRTDCLSGQAPRLSGTSNLTSLWNGHDRRPEIALRDPIETDGPPRLPRPGDLPPIESDGRPSRYQLMDEIARGGMGAVIRGRDVDLGRDLAIKVQLESHRDDPEMLRRFVEEAQIGGQLQHPGIVPVYDLGSFADRRAFFAMKLVRGRTLSALLRERTDPSSDLPRFLGIFEQVAQTLAYAHARGVIHRDLKPSNIMVGSFGEVQVMDWGLAKVLKEGGAADDDAASRPDASAVRTVRSGSDAANSRAGSVLGTPAYMPPEQARGEIDRLDERADVFGLGAILCEILTGKPPFIGDTAADLRDLSACGDLSDAFSRLATCGADADLLDLARSCLAPKPNDRPRDARIVAERMTSYLSGVQDRLRASELARAAAQARAEEEKLRRRLTVALAASIMALILLGGGAAGWSYQQRRERDTRIVGLLDEAGRALDRAERAPDSEALSAREEARTSIATAEELAGAHLGATAAVRLKECLQRLKEADRLRRFVAELEAIRGEHGDHWDPTRTDREYAATFRAFGWNLDDPTTDPTALVSTLAGRPAAIDIAGALDDWAGVRRGQASQRNAPPWRPLVTAARAIDPDPWRDKLRELLDSPADTLRAALLRLFDDPALKRQPAASLVLFAKETSWAGEPGRSGELLQSAWARFPDDFWLNLALGELQEERKDRSGRSDESLPFLSDESLPFLTTAVAIRPRSFVAHNNLGSALDRRGRHRAAIMQYREVIRLMPAFAPAHDNLGQALYETGDLEGAVAEYREAIRLAPDAPNPHLNLGNALKDRSDFTGAIAEYRIAIRLKADFPLAHNNLATALLAAGDSDGAIAEFREAIRLKPDDGEYHNNLGAALGIKGDLDGALEATNNAVRLRPDLPEARSNLGGLLHRMGNVDASLSELHEAIRLKPDNPQAHNNLGNLLYELGDLDGALAAYQTAIRLLPGFAEAHNGLGIILSAKGDFDGAGAEFREAIRATPDSPYAHNELGILLRERGDLDGSVAELKEAIRLTPDFAAGHCNLGLTLRAQGRYEESLSELRIGHTLGSRRSDWRYPSAGWLADAERMLALSGRLPAVLSGEKQPLDSGEALTFALMAHVRSLDVQATRLYAAALEGDRKLSDHRGAQHAYHAACCAALAGCGRGNDDPPPDEAARAKLRAQALGWLRSELNAWRRVALTVGDPDRPKVAPTLAHWKSDRDLAGVRDPEALAKLPEGEQAAWKALWDEVEALRKKVRPIDR